MAKNHYVAFRADSELLLKIDQIAGNSRSEKVLKLILKGWEALKENPDNIRNKILYGTEKQRLEYKLTHFNEYKQVWRERAKELFERDLKYVDALTLENTIKPVTSFNYIIKSNTLYFYSLYEWTYVQFIFDKVPIEYEATQIEDIDGRDFQIILKNIKDLEILL